VRDGEWQKRRMAKELKDERLQKGHVLFVGEKGSAMQTHFVLWKKEKGSK